MKTRPTLAVILCFALNTVVFQNIYCVVLLEFVSLLRALGVLNVMKTIDCTLIS